MARTGDEINSELTKALKSFDWKTADNLAAEMARTALRDSKAIDVPTARQALTGLRRKTRFQAMSRLAQALLMSGMTHVRVRRELAQAWIDQGDFKAAELILTAIADNGQEPQSERSEARGLLGRLNKQLYVEANRLSPNPNGTAHYLDESITQYDKACGGKLADDHWPCINQVATIARGRRDGLPLAGRPDATKIATELLAALKEVDDDKGVDLWQCASLMECNIALGDTAAARKAAERYVSLGGDAFEFASTIRQLEEVWQLTDAVDPGKQVLPVLRSALLDSYGGGMKLSGKEVKTRLEAVLGSDGFKSVQWYKDGLERCRSIARIVKQGSIGIGTGWLVKADDFYPGEPGVLLVTNAHVISKQAVAPADAFAQFQMDQPVSEWQFDSIFDWSPSEGGFDVCFLKFAKQPTAPPIPIAAQSVGFDPDLEERVFIIGHPYGGDLAFSLQDSLVIGSNDRLLHYRTPTTGGSSGSPVFNSTNWGAVALHHAGGQAIRLDGKPGVYDANEGISLQKIRNATQKGKLS